MKMKSVYDPAFRDYGCVLENYDFEELFKVLEGMPKPTEGIAYEPGRKELESCFVCEEMQNRGFGGMPIEVGYCSGHNRMLNCLEYHKNSEFNIAKDEVVLLLGRQQDIADGVYDTSKIEAFVIPAGVGVELYATTLHYAPCQTSEDGFRVVCVLPKGTNLSKPEAEKTDDTGTTEKKMLFAANKWLLAHEEADEALQGAYVGLKGKNLMI